MKTFARATDSREWDNLVAAIKFFLERVRGSEEWSKEEAKVAKQIAIWRESEKIKGKP
jgi:hypothetical protein